MRRLFANANYDFISYRRTAYIISGVALLLTVVTAAVWQFREGTWLNYGIDFTGGGIVQVAVAGEHTAGEIRQVVTALVPGSQVTQFGGANEFLIRTPLLAGDAATAGSDAAVAALVDAYGADQLNVLRVEAVSARVGGELQQRALIAILVSLVATLIYLAIRFEWRFGVAAIIATLHDIIFTLGLMAILRLEVNLPTVAAFLTIVGYSLNDTIVTFDRVRENLVRGWRKEFIGILNRSINETLPRTAMTSGTTLLTLFSLYMFGGAVIRDFALILIAGIILGTYSSIFVAAPALLEIEKRFPHQQKKVVRRTAPAKRSAGSRPATDSPSRV
jgi:preprotein translocase subunit SecF